MSCQSTACRPILSAPNGTLWQLGCNDLGLLTTTQVFLKLKYLQNPLLGTSNITWQLSATNTGNIVSTKVVNPTARLPLSYIILVSPGGNTFLLTIDSNGFLHTAQTNSSVAESIPYINDVTMSVYGDTCQNFVICPVCANASVTVSADLSCWCCTCSSFVLPEDTTIMVVLDE